MELRSVMRLQKYVLVDTLKEKLREDDEIVIQYDEGSVTDVVMEYLNIMKNILKIK